MFLPVSEIPPSPADVRRRRRQVGWLPIVAAAVVG